LQRAWRMIWETSAWYYSRASWLPTWSDQSPPDINKHTSINQSRNF